MRESFARAESADVADDRVDGADAENTARIIALRLLDSQPRTRAELARALARRGVHAGAATAVLDRFTEVGLIDDAAFASAWVDSRHAGRGLGRRALAAELRRKGVDDETVRDAVATVTGDDEHAAAALLVERRLRTMSGVPRDAAMRRLVGMLARKGYSPGLSYRVVKEALAEEGTDPEALPAPPD
jgi:regulatory protein